MRYISGPCLFLLAIGLSGLATLAAPVIPNWEMIDGFVGGAKADKMEIPKSKAYHGYQTEKPTFYSSKTGRPIQTLEDHYKDISAPAPSMEMERALEAYHGVNYEFLDDAENPLREGDPSIPKVRDRKPMKHHPFKQFPTAHLPALVLSLMHPKYYDELVDLAVEDVTYRVSKSLFSQSAPFSKVFCSHPGGQPISLIGATVSEMESLLDVLHARQTEAPLELKIEEWGGALHLATKWGFGTVREHIIKHIEHHSTDQEAVDRFELAMKCHVPQWLHPAYNTLCTRGQHITADEGRRLGYERLTAICRIREIFRLEPGKVDVNGRCGECDTCHSSGIRKHNVFGTFYFEELQCMSPPKVANANALQWISEDEHLKTSFSEVEEDITIAISVAHPNPPASAASDTEVSKRRASEIECLAPVTCVDRKPSDGPSNMVIVPEANNGSYYLANPSNHANVQPHTRILIIDPKVTNAGDTPPPVEPNAPAKKAKAKKAERKCPARAESRNKVGTESETH
ncbi:hypothetical protein FRB98_008347, partial [Tulasnella sp. 332]